MADDGSTNNLAAAVKSSDAATGEGASKQTEEKETRRQFNYPLVKVITYFYYYLNPICSRFSSLWILLTIYLMVGMYSCLVL